MKKAVLMLVAFAVLGNISFVYAEGDALPEVAAVDEQNVEPLPDFVPAE